MPVDQLRFDALRAVPCRIDVADVLSSRYERSANERPLYWDERVDGVDVVVTVEGQTLKLRSDGQQSPPKHGWGLIVTGGDAETGYLWTLYSLPKGAAISSGPRV